MNLEYFRKRGSVLFLSYCRFWEAHPFVQQSLARILADNGIAVTWIDGASWRPYQPVLYFERPNLLVKSIFEYPGRSVIPGLQQWDYLAQAAAIRRQLKKLPGRPVLWVQGGWKDRVVEHLPDVDIFSTFDDPHFNAIDGPLFGRSKLILCQNRFTYEKVRPRYPGKAMHSLPPVDMTQGAYDTPEEVLEFPSGFPEKRVGYIGTFFPEDFDLLLLENLVENMPHCGFVVMGRTRGEGVNLIEKLGRYKNFYYVPWAPREKVGAAWRSLSATALLYRGDPLSDGAFPVKVIESLHYGVPMVATRVPKTSDLEGVCLRTSLPDLLKREIEQLISRPRQSLASAYEYFKKQTDPGAHLAKASQFFS